jgi:hypothetical protein
MSLLLAATLAIAGTASSASAPSPAEAEMQLRAINHRFADAYRVPDPAYIETLASRDFLLTDIDGAWLGRDAFVATLQQQPPFADIAYDQVQVRLFGEVAVLHGVFHSLTPAGAAAQVRYTDVYAWQEGRWQLVSAQNTPVRSPYDPKQDAASAPATIAPWQGTDPQGEDDAVLATLNAQYVQAFRDADVTWYDAHLAPGYQVVFGDGSLHDRAAALADFAKPYFAEGIAAFPVDKVRIRRFGEVALIHAENAYTLKDGRKGVNRYTDLWVKRSGRWWCVAAHITVHRPPG